VPVRSGRCSPSRRIVRIRVRYWCSSWLGLWVGGILVVVSVVGGVVVVVSGVEVLGVTFSFSGEDGVMTGSRLEFVMVVFCVTVGCFVVFWLQCDVKLLSLTRRDALAFPLAVPSRSADLRMPLPRG